MSDQELVDLRSYRVVEENIPLPKSTRALQLLQMAYRGEIELTAQQFRAAKEALPFESPKQSTVTVVDGGFGERLERAIQASDKAKEVKMIEGRAIAFERRRRGLKKKPPPPLLRTAGCA